jgi:hypothetical protein
MTARQKRASTLPTTQLLKVILFEILMYMQTGSHGSLHVRRAVLPLHVQGRAPEAPRQNPGHSAPSVKWSCVASNLPNPPLASNHPWVTYIV